MAVVIFGIFATIVAVGGGVVFKLGTDKLAEAQALEPENEFISLGKVCYVKEEQKSEEYYPPDGENSEYYIDRYVYVFTVNGSNTTYNSREWEYKRDHNEKTEGPFEDAVFTGEAYQCWKPLKDRASLPELYQCGNDECYKIYNPASEASDIEDTAKVMILVGKIMLGVGLGLFVINGGICVCLCFAAARLPRSSHLPKSQPPFQNNVAYAGVVVPQSRVRRVSDDAATVTLDDDDNAFSNRRNHNANSSEFSRYHDHSNNEFSSSMNDNNAVSSSMMDMLRSP